MKGNVYEFTVFGSRDETEAGKKTRKQTIRDVLKRMGRKRKT
jgi:hypothetical protein